MALVASGGAMCICLVTEFSWGSVFRPIFVQGILTTTRGSTIPTDLVFFIAGGNSGLGNVVVAEIE